MNNVAEPSAHAATADNAGAREYQLNMSIGMTRDDGKATRDQRVNMALCMGPGKPASVKAHGLNVSTRVAPDADGKLGIDVTVADESGKTLAETRFLGRPTNWCTQAAQVPTITPATLSISRRWKAARRARQRRHRQPLSEPSRGSIYWGHCLGECHRDVLSTFPCHRCCCLGHGCWNPCGGLARAGHPRRRRGGQARHAGE
jgi:hypothetical protein